VVEPDASRPGGGRDDLVTPVRSLHTARGRGSRQIAVLPRRRRGPRIAPHGRMNKAVFAASLWCLVGACTTHGPLDPGSGNSVGSGTGTILVNGAASAQPSVKNATTPSDFTTAFSVQLTLNAAPLTTGTVTMTSASGVVTLTYQPAQGTGGRWQATGAGYDQLYQLDVISGADTIKGVRVDGPDIHAFTAPTSGAVVDSKVTLPLAWHRGATADAAVLRVGDGGGGGGGNAGLTIPDTGSYTMAAAALPSSKNQAQTSTLRLTRTNRVTPAGGAGGSEIAVSIANTVDVVAQINPTAP
jgi:hypothetical protein